MMNRRSVLALGGLLGGLGAPVEGNAGSAAAIGTGQSSDRATQDLTNAVKAINTTFQQQLSFDPILAVRKGQTDFLRANGKFPDFIDLGLDVWMGIHDWHIRMQQPLVLGRDFNGRYTMMLGFTALVLRPDSVPTLIGIPYDQR